MLASKWDLATSCADSQLSIVSRIPDPRRGFLDFRRSPMHPTPAQLQPHEQQDKDNVQGISFDLFVCVIYGY